MSWKRKQNVRKNIPNLISIIKKVPTIDENDVKHVMDILHLHFLGEYSAKFEPETKMFIFASDISMKYSIVKTLIAWNTQSVFNNILYDAKLVALLLTYVMGKENIQTNNLAKERMRFL